MTTIDKSAVFKGVAAACATQRNFPNVKVAKPMVDALDIERSYDHPEGLPVYIRTKYQNDLFLKRKS